MLDVHYATMGDRDDPGFIQVQETLFIFGVDDALLKEISRLPFCFCIAGVDMI